MNKPKQSDELPLKIRFREKKLGETRPLSALGCLTIHILKQSMQPATKDVKLIIWYIELDLYNKFKI